jgi:transposase
VARSDDRKVLSGIIHVVRNGLRWRDAPAEYGPHKTLYNRFVSGPVSACLPASSRTGAARVGRRKHHDR